MKYKYNGYGFWKLWLIMVLVYVVISVGGRWMFNTSLSRDHCLQNTSLTEDGYRLLQNVFRPVEIRWMQEQMGMGNSDGLKRFLFGHSGLHNALVHETNSEYEYQDYLLMIRKSQIHTCHRDYNGDLYHRLKHPSYTFIIYLHGMNSCLDIVEQSHTRFRYLPFSTDPSKHVKCQVGDVLLFNSNLIHAGSLINKHQNNPRIQMKWCHKDDRSLLPFYEQYFKLLDEENTNTSTFNHVTKHLSCQNPFAFEIGSKITNGESYHPPKWFTRFFYGNEQFLN